MTGHWLVVAAAVSLAACDKAPEAAGVDERSTAATMQKAVDDVDAARREAAIVRPPPPPPEQTAGSAG